MVTFERDDLAQESERAEHQERVPGPHEHQDAPEQIPVEDVVLDVVCVVLDAEREQLEDQAEQLDRRIVLAVGPVGGRVRQQRRHQHVHAVLVEEVEEVGLF